MAPEKVKMEKLRNISEEELTRAATVWVVGDMETEEGRLLYYNAIKSLKHSHNLRVGLIHNPTNTDQQVVLAKFFTQLGDKTRIYCMHIVFLSYTYDCVFTFRSRFLVIIRN